LKQKNKPIKEGYKVWCLGSHRGYYIDWLLHSPIDGAEDCNRKHPVAFNRPSQGPPILLAETFQVPLILLKKLKARSPHQKLLAFLDNLFLNIDVATALLALDIGVMGTTRKNSKGLPDQLIKLKDIKTPLIYGGNVQRIVDSVLCFAWQDNNIVLGITTAFSLSQTGDFILRDRKRPGKASTNARIALPVFGNEWKKELPIPVAIDAYNHGMNAVDVANQFRAHTTFHHQYERRNWRPLGFFLLDVCLGNSWFIWKAKQAHQSTHLRAQFNHKLIDALIARGVEHAIARRPASRRCSWGALHPEDCSPTPREYRDERRQRRQTRRVPLGETSGNSRHQTPCRRAAESIWGCNSCDVNLCTKRGCYHKWHRHLYDNLLWSSL